LATSGGNGFWEQPTLKFTDKHGTETAILTTDALSSKGPAGSIVQGASLIEDESGKPLVLSVASFGNIYPSTYNIIVVVEQLE
jgi:hypothetical protein